MTTSIPNKETPDPAKDTVITWGPGPARVELSDKWCVELGSARRVSVQLLRRGPRAFYLHQSVGYIPGLPHFSTATFRPPICVEIQLQKYQP